MPMVPHMVGIACQAARVADPRVCIVLFRFFSSSAGICRRWDPGLWICLARPLTAHVVPDLPAGFQHCVAVVDVVDDLDPGFLVNFSRVSGCVMCSGSIVHVQHLSKVRLQPAILATQSPRRAGSYWKHHFSSCVAPFFVRRIRGGVQPIARVTTVSRATTGAVWQKVRQVPGLRGLGAARSSATWRCVINSSIRDGSGSPGGVAHRAHADQTTRKHVPGMNLNILVAKRSVGLF